MIAIQAAPVAARALAAKRAVAPKGVPALRAKAPVAAARRAAVARRGQVKVQASAMEIAQVADHAKEILDAGIIVELITVVGLAMGFVMLRVEAGVNGADE